MPASAVRSFNFGQSGQVETVLPATRLPKAIEPAIFALSQMLRIRILTSIWACGRGGGGGSCLSAEYDHPSHVSRARRGAAKSVVTCGSGTPARAALLLFESSSRVYSLPFAKPDEHCACWRCVPLWYRFQHDAKSLAHLKVRAEMMSQGVILLPRIMVNTLQSREILFPF